MSMKTNDPVYFVYSEIQENEYNQVQAKMNKEFVCGQVAIGPNLVKFSAIIKTSQLDAMIRHYPDVKIVAEGVKTKFKYTEPKNQLILE